jgi:hypothetical protein
LPDFVVTVMRTNDLALRPGELDNGLDDALDALEVDRELPAADADVR